MTNPYLLYGGSALAALRKAGKDTEAQNMDSEICNVYPDRDGVMEVIEKYLIVEKNI